MLRLQKILRIYRPLLPMLPGLLLLAFPVEAKDQPPMHQVVKLASITVEPAMPADVTLSKEQESLVKLLEAKAIEQVEKQVLKRGVAATVVRLEPASSVVLPTLDQAPFISGTIRIPIVLHKEAHGANAAFHKTPFAIVKLHLKNADGSVITTREVVLKCSDVIWTSGGRYRRVRPLPGVLTDFVRKGIEEAVRQIRWAQVPQK